MIFCFYVFFQKNSTLNSHNLIVRSIKNPEQQFWIFKPDFKLLKFCQLNQLKVPALHVLLSTWLGKLRLGAYRHIVQL